MTQISSRSTAISRWLFPLAWFGFLIYFIAETLTSDSVGPDLLFIVVPMLMAVFGFFFFKSLVWDLADTVHDHGTFLVVRRRGVEERIAFENIMNMSATMMMHPPRVTLRLINPCAFGAHVSFSPKSSSLSLAFSAKNEIAESLMERAYAARANREV